jgi:hypothetical protein
MTARSSEGSESKTHWPSDRILPNPPAPATPWRMKISQVSFFGAEFISTRGLVDPWLGQGGRG